MGTAGSSSTTPAGHGRRDYGLHADVVTSELGAYVFYFTHPGGPTPCAADDGGDNHRSAGQLDPTWPACGRAETPSRATATKPSRPPFLPLEGPVP